MHGMLTPVCIHLRIQTGNRAHSRTSGISSACQAIKPMSSPASVPHSKRAAPQPNSVQPIFSELVGAYVPFVKVFGGHRFWTGRGRLVARPAASVKVGMPRLVAVSRRVV